MMAEDDLTVESVERVLTKIRQWVADNPDVALKFKPTHVSYADSLSACSQCGITLATGYVCYKSDCPFIAPSTCSTSTN